MIGDHDGELSQAAGADARFPARGTPGLPGIGRRRPGHVPALARGRRPGDLPVGGGHGHRAPSGWSPTRGRLARTRRTSRPRNEPGASGSARPPPGSWPTPPTARARSRSSRSPARSTRSRLARPTPTPRLIATQTPALDPRPDSTGTKVAYVHDGALRVVDLVSGRRLGDRGGRRPGRGHVRPGGVRRGRGDGPFPRLLVVARRQPAAHRPGRRVPGPAVVHRRPRQPGQGADAGALPGRRHPQRPRVAGARHHRQGGRRRRRGQARGGRVGPGRLPLPGRRGLGRDAADGRARPAIRRSCG